MGSSLSNPISIGNDCILTGDLVVTSAMFGEVDGTVKFLTGPYNLDPHQRFHEGDIVSFTSERGNNKVYAMVLQAYPPKEDNTKIVYWRYTVEVLQSYDNRHMVGDIMRDMQLAAWKLAEEDNSDAIQGQGKTAPSAASI